MQQCTIYLKKQQQQKKNPLHFPKEMDQDLALPVQCICIYGTVQFVVLMHLLNGHHSFFFFFTYIYRNC